MVEACGMKNIKSALDKLFELTNKYHIGPMTTDIEVSRPVKLNTAAIATGGPATTSDRVTKHATAISKRNGNLRIVRKATHKPWSATQKQDIAKVNEMEASEEGLACVGAHDEDVFSELTYWSSTEEIESVPVDENNRIFPGVPLDRLDDMGLTVSHLLEVKKARRTGTMAELMATETPEEVAKILAAEELLKKAEERK